MPSQLRQGKTTIKTCVTESPRATTIGSSRVGDSCLTICQRASTAAPRRKPHNVACAAESTRTRMQQHVLPRLVESCAREGDGSIATLSSSSTYDDAAAVITPTSSDAQRIQHLLPITRAFPTATEQHPHISHCPSPQQQQHLQPSQSSATAAAFPHRSAADIMLGLATLATHADRQTPILQSHHQQQHRNDSTTIDTRNPMPTFPSLRLTPPPLPPVSFARRMPAIAIVAPAPTGLFPSTVTPSPVLRSNNNSSHEQQLRLDPILAMRSDESGAASRYATVLSPGHFGAFSGHKHQRNESHVAAFDDDDATSPTARSQGYNSDREITLSPPSTVAPVPRLLPVATTIAWRAASSLFSPSTKRFRPTSPVGRDDDDDEEAKRPFKLAALAPQHSVGLPRSISGPAGSVATTAATTPPLLVRKSSTRWRAELAEADRRTSRERIQRALAKHADGDYDVLLLLIASMEEELLHIKTNAREHYHMQAQALSSEIQHASLER